MENPLRSFFFFLKDWLIKYCDETPPIKKPTTPPYDDTIPVLPKLNERVRISRYLHPCIREPLETSLHECHSQGLMVYVFESYRTSQRQQFLYDQGRTKPGRIVTNAKPFQSWHNYGLAFDMVFDGDERDGIQWSWEGDYNTEKIDGDKRSDYERVGEIFVRHGFEWGAQWKSFKEMPHFQKRFDLSLGEVQSIYDEGGLQAVWKEITRRDIG